MPTFQVNDHCCNSACPRGARPDWAGPVEITWESIMHATQGQIARTTRVAGIIVPGNTTGRPAAPEPSSGFRVSMSRPPATAIAVSHYNTGRPDLDKGHLMALELGGPDIPENIVPQWSHWQRNGSWRKLETSIRDQALQLEKAGIVLAFCVDVVYYQFRNNAWGTYDRLRVPKGFVVSTTKLMRSQLSHGLGAASWTEEFRGEQAQDAGDFAATEKLLRRKPRAKKRARATRLPADAMPPLDFVAPEGSTSASGARRSRLNASTWSALPRRITRSQTALANDEADD